jgi:hypothetical protein
MKYQKILDNYINGNLSDFREALKKLTKLQLLEFIGFWEYQGMEKTQQIINILIVHYSIIADK